MYKFIQDGDKYIISIDNHQEIMSALAAFCQEQGILAGEVHGIGAVNKATLRFLNPVTKKYVDKTFEEDGKVYLHVHANFGRADYTVVGGHLLSATLNGACELVVTRFHCKIDRQFDDETGLNLYKFD